MSQGEGAKKTGGCMDCVFYRSTRPHKFENGGPKTKDGEDIPPSHITCSKQGMVIVKTSCADFQREQAIVAA